MKIRFKSALINVMTAWAVLAAAVLAAGCDSSDAKQDLTQAVVRPVKAMQLSQASAARRLELPGEARAVSDTDLSFRVGGPLIALHVDTGAFIEKGQVVAQIDPRDFQVRVNTSRAKLNSARAQLREAKLQYARYAKLIGSKAVAQAEYDRVKAAYEVAAAGEQSYVKALEDAENALADTVLRAPFTGFINKRFVDNHETMKPGQPAASLVDLSSIEVRLALSEDLLPLVRNFGSFTCTFSALPGRTFMAKLKEVAKKADPSSRTYTAILTLDKNAAQVVRPGMSAEVSVEVAGPVNTGGFVVPLTALVNRGGQEAFVWVVEAKSGKLVRTPVSITNLRDGGAEVTGSLSAGQWIVTAGVSSLQEGQTVRLMDKPSKTNIGLEM